MSNIHYQTGDGNLYALEKHLKEQEIYEIAYDEMLEKLEELIEERIFDIRQEHDKLVSSYGFEQTLEETMRILDV